MLSAGVPGAVGPMVGPEIQVVEHRPGQRVGGLLVPGEHDVKPGRAVRHLDVDVLVGAIVGNCAGAADEPTLRP